MLSGFIGRKGLAVPLGIILGTSLAFTVHGAPAQANATGQWHFTGSMATDHNNWYNGGFAQLPDGRVLAISGSSGPGVLTTTAEIYDSATGHWSPAGSLNDARYAFGPPSVLPNGDVLVAGGHDINVNDYATAELYDPATNRWTLTGSLNTSRRYPVQVELANGDVLVATGSDGPPTCTRYLNSAELYNPATGQWTYTGSTLVPRESATAIRLADGRVLLAGGYNGSGPGCTDADPVDTEIYAPASGQWSFAGNLPHGWVGGTMVLLPDHRVLMVDGSQQGSPPFAEAVIFNPATNQWSEAAAPILPRSGAAATLLPDGNVLVSQGGQLQSEIYDPQTNTWSLDATTLDTNNGGHTFLLPNGQVLLAGGGSSTGAFTTAELYTPASPDNDLAIATSDGITANATSLSGAAVSYPLPTVTDPDDATDPAAADCSPAAGSVFPIGTTTVTCTATDPDDSNSPVKTSFTVTIKGAAAQLADLYQAVQGVGTGTSLADKIFLAQAYLAAGDITDASSTLDAFINEVTAQSGKSIPAGQAAELIADAQRIQALIRPVFVLIPGITSQLTSADISQGVTPGFDAIESLLQAKYPGAQFVTYSYTGSTKVGAPLPYGCVNTVTPHLAVDIQLLSSQIQAVLANEPRADIYLVGHSLGGIVAYGYMSALEGAKGIVAPLPQSNLKGVITLDSPIGGISNDPVYLAAAKAAFSAKCLAEGSPIPIGQPQYAVDDMSTIFVSTLLSTPPDSSAADPQGAQASVLSIEPNVALPYPSNQQAAEDANANGMSILAVGNTNDLLWRPGECLVGQKDFTDTQWLEDEGTNSGIYAREFTSGSLNCLSGFSVNAANHLDVLTDPGVIQAMLEFVSGATPAALGVAPPGPDS